MATPLLQDVLRDLAQLTRLELRRVGVGFEKMLVPRSYPKPGYTSGPPESTSNLANLRCGRPAWMHLLKARLWEFCLPVSARPFKA